MCLIFQTGGGGSRGGYGGGKMLSVKYRRTHEIEAADLS